MKKSYHLIANWKMNLSFEHASALSKEFSNLINQHPDFLENSTYVICPSFEAVYPIAHHFKNLPIQIGAQTCSPHRLGNFTGEVSAQSLKEMGCSYCIVGHSERRKNHHETEEIIFSITKNIVHEQMTPIFCIGETIEEYSDKKTLVVLEKQLETLFSALTHAKTSPSTCIIAYEPVWSIGTDQFPQPEYLHEIFGFISQQALHYNRSLPWVLVYGGGVSQNTLSSLLEIELINGFLIGRASTHLQQLESMIQHIRKLDGQ